jgi:hypothetical protein
MIRQGALARKSNRFASAVEEYKPDCFAAI